MNPPSGPSGPDTHLAGSSGAIRPWRWQRLAWLPWAILVVGVVLAWTQYQAIESRKHVLEATRFNTLANEVALALERRLQTNTDLLRGVSGLFAASQFVDRQEFKTYVDSLALRRHYPGIQGIGFSQWLAADELRQHVEKVRAEGFPEYEVHPAGGRPHYSSILYLEPFDWRNQRAFGFDMYSEDIRRQAMRSAVDKNDVSISGRVTLLQETEKDAQAGFLIYLPVYENGAPLATVEQRWKALKGWTYSPIRARDLMRSFVDREFSSLQGRMSMRLYASDQPLAHTLLYEHLPQQQPLQPTLEVARQIDVDGAKWLMQVAWWGGAPVTDDDDSAIMVLWGGTTLALTVAMLAWLVLRHQRSIAQALQSTMRTNVLLAEKQASLRLAGIVMKASPLGIFVTDEHRRIISVNPAFSEITGWQPEALQGQEPPGLQDATFRDEMWGAVARDGEWEGDFDSRRADGAPYPQRLAITRVTDDDGRTLHYVGLFSDITEQREAEDHIRKLAHHDYLTGLPNRALLMEQAGRELQAAARYDRHPVLMFIDLDQFKPINDQHGHDTGDEVLIQVAQRLTALLRETDLVCRQGGDEFVVLLPDHAGLEGVRTLAAKLLAAIREPYNVGSLSLRLDASIGIAIYPEHGQTVDALIDSADAAMYLAKGSDQQKICLAGETPAA